MLARIAPRGYLDGMNSHWILAAMMLVPGARAQQAGGGATGSGTVGTVLPQVAPGMQQNNNNNAGGGISFVTRRTPTAVGANQARGFFAAGGVNLGGAAVGAGAGSVGGMETAPITAGVNRRSVALPTEAELANTSAAAQRGDAKAQARLAEYRRALTGGSATVVTPPAPTAAAQPVRAAKPQDPKYRKSPGKSGSTVK